MNRVAAAIIVLAGSVQLSCGVIACVLSNGIAPAMVLGAVGLLITLGGFVGLFYARPAA
jgi:hypothetical protein